MKTCHFHQAFKLALFTLLLSLFSQNIAAGQQAISGADIAQTLLIDPIEYQPDNEKKNLFKSQFLGDIPPTNYMKETREDGTTIIRAQSKRSASGLVIPLTLDPAIYRYVRWEWKIDSVLES